MLKQNEEYVALKKNALELFGRERDKAVSLYTCISAKIFLDLSADLLDMAGKMTASLELLLDCCESLDTLDLVLDGIREDTLPIEDLRDIQVRLQGLRDKEEGE